jgi:hypothetical protein
MKNAVEKLSFTQQYVEWKRAKEWVKPMWTPEEFLEEAILHEKAEVYDKIYDLLDEEDDSTPENTVAKIRDLIFNE